MLILFFLLSSSSINWPVRNWSSRKKFATPHVLTQANRIMFSRFLISIAIKKMLLLAIGKHYGCRFLCVWTEFFFMSRLVVSHSYAIVFLLIKLQQLFLHQDLECRERLISKWHFKREDTCDLKLKAVIFCFALKGKVFYASTPLLLFPHVNLYILLYSRDEFPSSSLPPVFQAILGLIKPPQLTLAGIEGLVCHSWQGNQKAIASSFHAKNHLQLRKIYCVKELESLEKKHACAINTLASCFVCNLYREILHT